MKLFQIQDRAASAHDDAIKTRVMIGQLIKKLGYCKDMLEDIETIAMRAEQNGSALKAAVDTMPEE